MDVVLFSGFSKAINSTKSAEGHQSMHQITGELKEGTSIINPSIRIDYDQDWWGTWQKTPADFTYCYIPYFYRYYFITDWVYEPPYWIAVLAVDVMGTFRGDIFNSYQYVTRSASHHDFSVPDTMYPATSSISSVTNRAPSASWGVSPYAKDGFFVVGCISSETNAAVGAVTYYVMDQAQMSNFKQFLLGSINWASIDETDLTAGIQKALINPFQYVVSCKFFPFAMPAGLQTVNTLKFGWWQLPFNGLHIWNADNTYAKRNIPIVVPKHPQQRQGNDYLNLAPYSNYTLQTIIFGDVSLRPEWLINVNTLLISLYVDLVTGTAIMLLDNSGGWDAAKYCLKLTGKFCTDIQLASLAVDTAFYTDPVKTVTSAAMGTAFAASTGTGGLTIQNALSGIMSSVANMSPLYNTSGTNGAIIGEEIAPAIYAEFHHLAEFDPEHFGYALCQKKMLGQLYGYCQCTAAEITAARITKEEKEMVERYLNGGCFIE